MEDEIAGGETSIRNRRRYSDATDVDEKVTDAKAQGSGPKTIQTLNKVPWLGFKRKWEEREGGTSHVHAIDVLIGDAVIPHDVWRNRFARSDPLHLYEQAQRFKL
jgi:hypothetical protein